MAEFTTLPSPTMEKQHKRPISSSFFSSPRLFTGFANPKPEPESVMSPTSTLDSKPFSHLRSPFSSEPNSLNKPGFSEPEPAKIRPWKKPDSQGIGLGIVSDESSDPRKPKPATRMVLFGSHLKIQIPIQPESPKPADFGIRTRNPRTGSGFSIETPRSGRVFSGSITPTEMELSEEYTCVITHGPNPKTTHIFDNCVVLGFSEAGKEGEDRTVAGADRTVGFASESFLSFCYTCKRNLGPGKDTYMYRLAFCFHFFFLFILQDFGGLIRESDRKSRVFGVVMAATEQELALPLPLPFSVSSIVEDVLQQHGSRTSHVDIASRKAEEASLRRYEAAGWLRKTIGVVGGKDLPAEPSEEEFMLGLRSGIILCSVLNKINPGAVAKVVEGPSDSIVIPDGAALSAFQHFENIRNFIVAVKDLGLPTFEASDLEQGGKSAKVVNCVLALKSYSEWKQAGGIGMWKFGALAKPASFKPFVRKNSEPFANSFLRTLSWGEKSVDSLSSIQSCNGDLIHELNEAGSSRSLNVLVREALSDKRQEEIPLVIESMLSKVVEEFERRLASQSELMKTIPKESGADWSLSKSASEDIEMEAEGATQTEKENGIQTYKHEDGSRSQLLKQQVIVDQQQRHIQDLKHTLYSTKAGIQFLQRKYEEEFDNLGKHLHGLAYAASGYQRVLEENRKLYNQVQDLKGNIRVYCRVRPFLAGQPNRFSTVENIDEGNLTILTPAKYCKEGRKSFNFNKVFGPCATQEEVFDDTRPLIRSVLDGYNVCIFAYGQTGSGKTFTMTGPRELTEESQGVNYRALHDLFLLSEQRKDTFFYEISVQMLEIYNEQVRDLLVMDGSNKRLEIRNSSQNGINVPEANLVPVSSTSDVLYLMNLGQKNRAVGATAMNDRSSRSHSCLTVHVQGKDLTSGTVLRGCMHLVDLAGSERVDKSEVTGDRLKEAQHINKSLSALGDVIAALAQKNSHVPYRNSKLTQLLQDSLGGQAKTLMFVHISPEFDAAGETISTLKFAERVSTVELGAARANKDSGDVKELKEQIASLKAALARKEADREHLQYSRSSSPDRFRAKSGGSSPSWRSLGELPSGRRQPMEDVASIQNSASKLRRRSLDPQEVLTHSPSWASGESTTAEQNGKEDDKESVSSEWDDKLMVLNRHDAALISREDNLVAVGSWDDSSSRLSEMFGRRYLPDPSKVYTTDDSDDHEAATSDSSEPDVVWHLNCPKAAANNNDVGNGLGGTQAKKLLYTKSVRTTETRSLIPSLIPSPSLSRKTSNGVSQLSQASSYRPVVVRQALHGQGKRRTAK